MSEFCGNCGHLDKNGACKWGDEYYCEITNKYTSVKKTACSSFVPRPASGYKRSGCYITTICCQLLNYPDDCEVLNLLRELRDSYLKTTPEGINILKEYDQIGPIISDKISQESPLIAIDLMQRFLIPSALATKKQEYEKATTIYLNMVSELKSTYSLIDMAVDYSIDTPIETLGKARIRQNPSEV